jgi:alkanesulfonate monooxygenase SsuD/methylene tetrahydromethanopterin reductase-like flavin-dependent oxidoreductase (luciferase family)
VLQALFSGRAVDLDGPTITLRRARLLPEPVQQRRIPLWVGGKGGPRLLRLAARHADGWNAVWRWSPRDHRDRAIAARRACEEESRDPATFRFSVGLYSLLGENRSAFRAVFDRGRASMPGHAMKDETEESWLADTLSGTPEQAIERVLEFESAGVEEIIVAPWVLPFAVPEPDQLWLFAEQVMAPLRAGA